MNLEPGGSESLKPSRTGPAHQRSCEFLVFF